MGCTLDAGDGGMTQQKKCDAVTDAVTEAEVIMAEQFQHARLPVKTYRLTWSRSTGSRRTAWICLILLLAGLNSNHSVSILEFS